MRQILLIAVAVLLAGCQGTLPGKKASDVTPNAITGGEIEVTALDAPQPGPETPVPAAAPKPGGEGSIGPKPAQQGQGAKPGPAVPASPADAATGAAEAAAVPAPTPEAAEEAAPPKSDDQLACEKKRGKWSKVGKGELYACVYQTRDSGKRCERESQCEGACLARSGTCAPFKPLYGCNDILQDDGQRVTLCID